MPEVHGIHTSIVQPTSFCICYPVVQVHYVTGITSSEPRNSSFRLQVHTNLASARPPVLVYVYCSAALTRPLVSMSASSSYDEAVIVIADIEEL